MLNGLWKVEKVHTWRRLLGQIMGGEREWGLEEEDEHSEGVIVVGIVRENSEDQ